LSFDAPAEKAGVDEYVSDPAHPVPFVGYPTDTVPQRYMADDRFVKLPDYEYRVYLGLGTVAAQQGNSEQAKAHLRRALEVKPAGSEAYSILAGVLSNLDRDPEGAIPFLERAIALDPVDDQARDSMGVALYNLRRYDEAVPYFREALRINPQSDVAQQHLRTVLRRLEQ